MWNMPEYIYSFDEWKCLQNIDFLIIDIQDHIKPGEEKIRCLIQATNWAIENVLLEDLICPMCEAKPSKRSVMKLTRKPVRQCELPIEQHDG
jgi:hypothetical protein